MNSSIVEGSLPVGGFKVLISSDSIGLGSVDFTGPEGFLSKNFTDIAFSDIFNSFFDHLDVSC